MKIVAKEADVKDATKSGTHSNHGMAGCNSTNPCDLCRIPRSKLCSWEEVDAKPKHRFSYVEGEGEGTYKGNDDDTTMTTRATAKKS